MSRHVSRHVSARSPGSVDPLPLDPADATQGLWAWASIPAATPRRDVARVLVRSLVDIIAPGCDIALSNPCPRCGGPHGPVVVTGAPVVASVAYATRRGASPTKSTIAVAAAARESPAASGPAESGPTDAIGIDAEFVDDPVRDGIGLAGVLAEGASIRDWVRVEAALKADGRGLRAAPESVEVRPREGGWVATVAGSAHVLHGRDLSGPSKLIVSVARRLTRQGVTPPGSPPAAPTTPAAVPHPTTRGTGHPGHER